MTGNSIKHQAVEGNFRRKEQSVQRDKGIKVHESFRTPGVAVCC